MILLSSSNKIPVTTLCALTCKCNPVWFSIVRPSRHSSERRPTSERSSAVPEAESPRAAPSSASSSAADAAAGQPVRPAAILCLLTQSYSLAYRYPYTFPMLPTNPPNCSLRSSNNGAMYLDLFLFTIDAILHSLQ